VRKNGEPEVAHVIFNLIVIEILCNHQQGLLKAIRMAVSSALVILSPAPLTGSKSRFGRNLL
jgi:hypothetical protein